MKKRSKILWVALAGMFLLLTSCSAWNHFQTKKNPHLQPSSTSSTFDRSDYQDFSDYIEQTSAHLKTNKVFMDDHNKQQELDAAAPFELRPANHCSNRSEKGVLLIHGLADMPLAMRDLAQAFSEQCFLVRAILLPGHGARAADLLSITRQDWLNAVRFGIETLKQDIDQVYVGGFSLGGLLSVYAAAEDPEIKGTFAFSPALALDSAWQIRQSVWLRHVVNWLDKDEQDDYARFEAMPINAAAQTYLLTQDLQLLLSQQSLTTPVFLVQSSDDPIIDVTTNQRYFSNDFTNPANRLIIYQQNPANKKNQKDNRIEYVNSYLPKQRIISFSHQATHISPNNMHYGINGDYRNCGGNADRNEKEVRECLTAAEIWHGELFGRASNLIPDNQALTRLTFNPYFDQLMQQIDEFVSVSRLQNAQ